MLIIGVAGPAGSGKDVVADWIVDCTGRFIKLPFAKPIKDMLATMGLTHAQLYGNLKEEVDPRFGRTPRDMMQTLGTEWGREKVSPDIWVQSTFIELDKMAVLGTGWARAENAVISDVRFDNEAEMIRERGGFVIHIEGRDPGIGAGHASEAGVSWHGDDMVVQNVGDMTDLINACQPVIERIYDELES